MTTGAVEHIHLAAEHAGPPHAVDEVPAEAGVGLRGDRHHGREGANDLTLIEGRAYSAGEYRAWLREAGLKPADVVVPTLVHCGVLEGRKG